LPKLLRFPWLAARSRFRALLSGRNFAWRHE